MAPDDAGDAGKHSLWRRLLDFVFGYDFFISYAWSDGGAYATALTQQLRAQGFEIFLDREEYASGDDWKKVGAWKLRRTGQLVLVGSPAALTSAPVLREIQIFASTGRRIVPIDFDGSLEWKTSESPLAQLLPAEILRIREPAAALKSGPSEQVIATLRRTFNLVRQDKKRARVFGIIAVVLGVLAVGAGTAAVIAVQQRDEATRQALISAHEAYAADIELSEVYRRGGNPDRAVEMLRKHRPRGDALPDLREFAWRYLWRLYDNHRHAIFVTGQPTGLDLSPDGKMLAIANESPLVTLWDTGTGQQIGKFVHPGSEKVKSAAFVADGTRIATVAEGRLRLWDRQRPEEPVATFETIFWDALSTDRSTLIANEDGEQLQLIDARTGTKTSIRPAEELGAIEKRAIRQDRKAIAVTTTRNRVFVFDADKQQITYAADFPSLSAFAGIQLTADGALLVAGKSEDQSYEIVVRDLATDTVRQRLRGPKVEIGHLAAMAVSGDGGKIALLVGDPDVLSPEQYSRLVVFDARTGQELYALDQDATGFVTAMAFSPTADVLVTGNRNHQLVMRNATTGRAKALIGVHHNTPTRDADERNVHREEGVLFRKSSHLRAGISKILFSPDGSTIVSANTELGSVRIWNADIESSVHALPVHADHQTAAAFSPDGQVAVTGSAAGEIATWRAQDGTKQSRAAGHRAAVSRIAFSRTGATFASASEDGVIKLWRTADLTEQATFRGAAGTAGALVVGEDRLVHVSTPPPSMLASATPPTFALTSWLLGDTRKSASMTFRSQLAVLSPHGERLAVLQDDEEQRACRWMIVDVESGASRAMPIDSDRCFMLDIQRAAWAPDGKQLAFGGPAVKLTGESRPKLGGIRIFDVDAGSERPLLPVLIGGSREGALAGLEISPDGRTLATLSAVSSRDQHAFARPDQPVVTLFDVASLERNATRPVASELCKGRGVECVTFGGFSADGKALALIASERPQGPGKSEAIVLRLDDGTAEHFASPRATRSVAISPGGDRVAAVMMSGNLGAPSILWDRKTGSVVASLGNYESTVNAATRSPDGRIVVQTLERPLPNGTLARVWDLKMGDMLASGIDPRDGGHRVTDVSPKGDLVALMDGRGSVTMRDARTRSVLRSIDTKMADDDRPDTNWLAPVPLVVFTNEGSTLATVGAKEVTQWDVKTGTRLHSLTSIASTFVPSAGGTYAAMVSCKTTTVYDTRSGRQSAAVANGDTCSNGAAVSADGTLLLSLASGGDFTGPTEARLWRLGTSTSTVLTGYDDAGAIGAFAGDGRTIATAGPDGTVNLWDPVTSRRLLTLPGFKQRVSSLRFTDDGGALVVGYQNEVRVWPAVADARRQ